MLENDLFWPKDYSPQQQTPILERQRLLDRKVYLEANISYSLRYHLPCKGFTDDLYLTEKKLHDL